MHIPTRQLGPRTQIHLRGDRDPHEETVDLAAEALGRLAAPRRARRAALPVVRPRHLAAAHHVGEQHPGPRSGEWGDPGQRHTRDPRERSW
jgi:hypothetical protein